MKFVVELADIPGQPREREHAGTRISVTVDAGCVGVEVSRSLYTSNELYLVADGDGVPLIVTDHFLTAVRHCRPEQRTLDDDAIIDHLLFRTVPADKSYARGVFRLGHGCTGRWDSRSAKLCLGHRERVERPVDVPFSEAVKLLERSLENIMASMITGAPDRTVTNLLSGGVDSTLLQTFLPRSGRSLSVAIDTPEFAAETQRALSASALTGTDHQLVSLSESGYLEALERFITVTGLPPHHMQSVLFGEMFRLCEGERRYLVTAQFADALFGLHSLARAAGVLRRWGWLPVITRKRGLPAALKPARLRLAESWSELLDQRVGSTEGLAARAASYTDFAVAERAFGAARIRSRLERRLQYVLDICPFLSTAESGHDAQLEAAHLVDYFCDDAVSIWRQAAMSYGAYLISPFTHPEIFRSSLRFSKRDRYWRHGQTKPALKALLRKRLPRYDIDRPKLGSGLPVGRFVDSGPLRDHPYVVDPPDFARAKDLGIDRYPPWIAWNILTLSMWRLRVAANPGTPPTSLARRLGSR